MKDNPTHGGQRKGAGRPKTIKKPRKTYSFELFIEDMELIPGNRARFVREAIRAKLIADGLKE
jgi:hypothetical protein